MTDFEKTYQNYNPRAAALAEARALLTEAAMAAMADGTLPEAELPAFIVEIPADTKNGDIASNLAMAGARTWRKAPKMIADALLAHLPALEGGVIRTGMCAGPGAVEQVDIRGEQVTLRVIGGEKARGICGSGIVDLLAELFLEGIIDFRGTFQPEKSRRVVQAGEELAYCYAEGSETADGQPLLFYQSDIQEFLATKAAAYTMVEYMLKAIGMSFDDVEKFYVAGAFGTYIRTASAVTIGLYPDLPEEKVACVGNSSLEGARTLLLDRDRLGEINEILEKMDYIQYGAIPDFVDSMSAARAIPHLDTARYPSVMKWKAQRQSRA